MRVLLLTATALPLALAAAGCGPRPAAASRKPPIKDVVDFPLQDPRAHVVKLTQVAPSRLEQSTTIPVDSVVTEVFKQQEVPPPRIDILIVIDNSRSMEEEQLNLSDKLTALVSDLSEIEWQINVITTDDVCKRLPELPLKPDTPDMARLFEQAVRAGISGSGYETALANAIDHLSGRCSSDGPWRRAGADMAVLIVSDEDEDESSRYAAHAREFVADATALGYTPGDDFRVYGIIGHPDEPCATVEAPARTYADVVAATDGLWGSICAPDYSPTLNAISRDIRRRLALEFPLRFKPLVTTLTLDLDGVAYGGDWTVFATRLILAQSLPNGSTLTVRYQVESFRLIDLGVPSDRYRLERLAIDGKTIDPSLYHYDAAANTVLLTFDPTPGGRVTTELVDTTSLIERFPFPEVEAERVTCYVGDEPLAAKITTERGTIAFDPPLPAGATAHCLYTDN